MKKFIILISLALFWTTAILINPAQSGAISHGLSLFGDLKYEKSFTNFDYVNPDAPKGGGVRYATVGSFDSLNPYILKGVAAAGSGLPFDSLLVSAADEPDSAYGLIASAVERAKDNRWVKFKINAKAHWHDGSPIRAEDIVYSFNTLVDKGHPNFSIMLSGVSTVEKINDLEVVFHIEEIENLKLPLIIGSLPIFSKKYFLDKKFEKSTLIAPLGSGPYRILSVDPGRAVTYERVDNYWASSLPVNKGRYNFDTINYDYYRDRDVMVEALKAGEYDFHEEFTSKTWATAYDIDTVRDGWLKKEVLSDNTPSGVQAFFINTRRDKFQSRKVREALSFAFDYEWANKNLFYGLYQRMDSYFENSDLAASGLPHGKELALLEQFKDKIPNEVFTKEFVPPQTDGSGNIRSNLRQADKLLKEAGWVLINGQRKNKLSGEIFDLELLYYERTFERVLAPFARNLEKLGIAVSLRLVDVTQYINRLEDHDFDITTRRFVQQLSPGPELLSYFGSLTANLPGTSNSSGIKDPVVDKLIETLLAATNRSDLLVAARALDRVLLWGHYMIPQWYKGQHHIVYWDFFDRPEIKPDYDIGLDTWWWNAKKVKDFVVYRSSGE